MVQRIDLLPARQIFVLRFTIDNGRPTRPQLDAVALVEATANSCGVLNKQYYHAVNVVDYSTASDARFGFADACKPMQALGPPDTANDRAESEVLCMSSVFLPLCLLAAGISVHHVGRLRAQFYRVGFRRGFVCPPFSRFFS